MEIISKEEFTELINYRGLHCISIYMPAHRAGVEVNEKKDAILLKNLLQKVNSDLRQQGLNAQTIEQLLKPGFDLYNNEVFWNSQLDGLALFLADGYFKVIQLPFTLKEETYLNNSFYVSPLLPAITNDNAYYLLVLSKHDAKFYQGNNFGLQRILVEGLPNGMDDVVHFEEKEDWQLFRRGGRAGGEGGANFHGHGEGQLDDKANIAIYFQEVDKTLFKEVLHDKNVPLILAGVDYLIPIYKGLSKYNFVADAFLSGSQEHENLNGLFTKSWELAAPYFQQKTNKALENYYNQISTSFTSSMPEKVVPASYYAQVSDLFVCRNAHIWGKFNEADQKIQIHREKEAGDECLINQAVVKTYSNGGNVYLLDAGKMPKESVIAATLRF